MTMQNRQISGKERLEARSSENQAKRGFTMSICYEMVTMEVAKRIPIVQEQPGQD